MDYISKILELPLAQRKQKSLLWLFVFLWCCAYTPRPLAPFRLVSALSYLLG